MAATTSVSPNEIFPDVNNNQCEKLLIDYLVQQTTTSSGTGTTLTNASMKAVSWINYGTPVYTPANTTYSYSNVQVPKNRLADEIKKEAHNNPNVILGQINGLLKTIKKLHYV